MSETTNDESGFAIPSEFVNISESLGEKDILNESGNDSQHQIQDQIRSEIEIVQAESQSTENLLCKLERKMSNVVLNEQHVEPVAEQMKEEQMVSDAIEMAEEKIDGNSVRAESQETLSQNEIKVETETDAADFMDIEDDAPFVRRSRRLQSIYSEASASTEDLPSMSYLIRKENSKEAKTEATSAEVKVEPTVAQVEPTVKQSAAAKPELYMTVEQFDERLKRYETIRDNIYSKKSDKKLCKMNKSMKCDCTITEEEVKNGEVGCQYNCINRILYIECGLKCRCGGELVKRRLRFVTNKFFPLRILRQSAIPTLQLRALQRIRHQNQRFWHSS